ncbi:aldehyde dehydrogenase family protein [Sneathiella aquimaris]|uniref:aldehyde dehydrogenase family protein n=1 Tax=Sneathiella aquimaris TaxID=2599305 RepID=UPI001469D9D9|nr:aldehyde dehydrogenase family protein [Sneathiella aquimaris]
MLEVINPFDLQSIDAVPLVNWETIDKWLTSATNLHSDRRNRLPSYKRIEILKNAANLMTEQTEYLAHQIAVEGGKPIVDARIEVARAIDGVELGITELSHLKGTEIPMDLTKAGSGRIAFTMREPIGPVVAVSAFNHPLNLIVHQVVPAVAVGCPVLVKPADDTPLSCRSFVKILYEAGLPEEWCRFTPCDIPTAEKMVTDKRVAFFSFIGSANVGWMLRSKLAAGTRCALEHGGAAPVILDTNADREPMISSILKGGFYHSGQVCVSTQRIFASKSQSMEIAEELAAEASKLIVGDATLTETDCGPLIRTREVSRIADWVCEAKKSGASVLCGGDKLSDTMYAPTVLFNPPHDIRVSNAEIFGPIICVYSYETLTEAFEQANAHPFAFQSSVFTGDLGVAMDAIQQLNASAVMVNDHTAFRVDWMPFSGQRQSGYNTGGIGYTMHDMTQEKMAVIKL